MPLFYYLAFFCAFLYALSLIFIKKGSEEGLGITRIFFLNNIFRLPIVIPLFFFAGDLPDIQYILGALLAAALCFASTLILLAAVRMGDVSIQTPLMGTKVLFVAILSVIILGSSMTLNIWLGAILAFCAVLVLGFARRLKSAPQLRMIVTMLLASFLFAATDVTITYFAPNVGEYWMIIIINTAFMFGALLLIPFFRKKGANATRLGWKMGITGGLLIAFEETFYFWIIAYFKEPALTNIVYSSRGIWSIALVWLVGRQIGVSERDSTKRVVILRLLAAVLIIASVAFTLLS